MFADPTVLPIQCRRCVRIIAGALTLAACLSSPAHADTIIPGGNLFNQTWTQAGSPYIIAGDITVPAGASLQIEAGGPCWQPQVTA